MDVSIIIVNYNTRELLFNCIKSIYEHTKEIEFEVIVADNHSFDGSAEMLQKEFQSVRIIRFDNNLGFGKANNEASKVASGDYLFFLNSDTVIKNNAVKLFFDFMEKYGKENKIGAVGSWLLDENNKITHSYSHFPIITKDLWFEFKTLLIDIFGRERYYNLKLKSNTRKKINLSPNDLYIDYITGANLFTSKILFNRLNCFDNRFFMYFEETDLQYRMYKEGYRRKIISGPKIIHFEGASFDKKHRKASNLKRIYFEESLFCYYKKHFNSSIYYTYRAIHSLLKIFYIFDMNYSFKENVNYIIFVFTKKISR